MKTLTNQTGFEYNVPESGDPLPFTVATVLLNRQCDQPNPDKTIILYYDEKGFLTYKINNSASKYNFDGFLLGGILGIPHQLPVNILVGAI